MPALTTRALLVAVLALLVGLLARIPSKHKLDFVTCDVMGHSEVKAYAFCGPSVLLPSLPTADFYDAAAARAAEIRDGGSAAVVMHIGASDFATAPHLLFTSLLARLEAQGSPTKLVLVEPQTELLPALRDTASFLPIYDEQLHLANVAVDPGCTGEPFRMFGWSKKLQAHFAREVPLHGFTSTHRDFPMLGAFGAAFQDPSNPWQGEWSGVFARLSNISDYVEEVLFPCETVPGLLSTVEAEAKDIAFLLVDAEALNCEIMLQSLTLEGFRPALIIIAASMATPLAPQVSTLLAARGYLIGMTFSGSHLLAVDARLYQMPPLFQMVRLLRPWMRCRWDLCWS